MKQVDIENQLREVVSRLITEIELATKQGRFDINLISEDAWIPILKEVYQCPNLINLNDLDIACVDSFFALDGAKSWKPEKVLLGEVAHVIDVGLVLLIVGQSNLPNNYKQKINESVVVG